MSAGMTIHPEAKPGLIGLEDVRAVYREGASLRAQATSRATELALQAMGQFDETQTDPKNEHPEVYYQRKQQVFNKVVGWVAKLAVRNESIIGSDEDAVIDTVSITSDITDIEAIWSEFFPKESVTSENVWARLSLLFSPRDLLSWLESTTANPYAGPTEIKYEMRQGRDPETSLRTRTELYGQLMEKYAGVSQYAGPTEIRHEVRVSKYPETTLLVKIVMYERLMARYASTSEYVGPTEIKDVVRRRKDPKAVLLERIEEYERLVEQYAGTSEYVGPVEVKRAVSTSRDPETSLRTRTELYGQLMEKYAGASSYVKSYEVKGLVRKSKDPEATLIAKIEEYERLMKRYAGTSEYVGPLEVQRSVSKSKDPEATLIARIQEYERLVEQYIGTSEYVGLYEIKRAVRDSGDPEAVLLANIELYERLVKQYVGMPQAVIRYIVSTSKPEHAPTRLQDIEVRARDFAESHNTSLKLGYWLAPYNRDNAEGLQQYLQFVRLMNKRLISLDANRSKNGFWSLHESVASDLEIRQEEAEEAADELTELINAAGINETEKEALMLTFVDENKEKAANCLDVEIDQVDTRIEELLIRLRASVRRYT